MVIDTKQIFSGFPVTANRELTVAANNLLKLYSKVKVGITNNPEVRAAKYQSDGEDWEIMKVSYESDTHLNMTFLQKELTKKIAGLDYEIEGGPEGELMQYLYFVVKK